MYTTKNLITKSWGHYNISDPRLASKLAYLSGALGITHYDLYKAAHQLYKNRPYIYDWDTGINILLIKVAMGGIIATIDNPLMTSIRIYALLRDLRDEGEDDIYKCLDEPWVRYPHIAETTQKEILDKMRGFGYLNPTSGFNTLGLLIKTIFRACYIWAWSVDHFTKEEFEKLHNLYYKLLFRDVDPQYITQAQNIIENHISNMEDNLTTQVYFY